MSYVDISLGPRVLGVFDDNRPGESDFHAPVFPTNIDYWHGFQLREEDRKDYNLYMRTLPDGKYSIGVDYANILWQKVENPDRDEVYKNQVHDLRDRQNELMQKIGDETLLLQEREQSFRDLLKIYDQIKNLDRGHIYFTTLKYA